MDCPFPQAVLNSKIAVASSTDSFFLIVLMLHVIICIIIRLVIRIFRIGFRNQVVDKIQAPIEFRAVFLAVLGRVAQIPDADIIPPVTVSCQLGRAQRRQVPFPA